MRKTALVLLLLAGLAFGDTDLPSKFRTWSATQGSTATAPTTVTQGMPLGGVLAFRVEVCAASGQTLTGSGSIRLYVWQNESALWTYNPALDQAIPSGANGNRCWLTPDLQTLVDSGRLFAGTVSAGISSGNVTVRIKARVQRGSIP